MADQFTPIPVKGNKTRGSAPTATEDYVPVLPGIVESAVSAKTNGRHEALSIDTNGRARVVLDANSDTDPLYVVVSESEGTPKDSGHLTSASVAAGASVDLDATAITNATTGRLQQITAAASVRIKVQVQTVTGGVGTTVRTFFVEAGQSLVYDTSESQNITRTGGAGNFFRLRITNLDNLNAADVYGSVSWIEV